MDRLLGAVQVVSLTTWKDGAPYLPHGLSVRRAVQRLMRAVPAMLSMEKKETPTFREINFMRFQVTKSIVNQVSNI